MKVSIITAVLNGEAYISETIESVLSQDYEKLEYILIDGASSDGTINVINEYRSNIATVVSEPDAGIYDALNKGIVRATGDIIGFLHSGDVFLNRSIISGVVGEFVKNHSDAVYGDLIYSAATNIDKCIRYWKSGEYEFMKLKKGWMPPHPAFFVKKHVYDKCGVFDQQFKISADYDMMIRILKAGVNVNYIPKVLVKMRMGGASNQSLGSILRKSMEDYRVIKNNGLGGVGVLLRKNLIKIPQFFQIQKS